MRKEVVGFLFLLTFLGACTSGSKEEQQTGQAFVGGTQGLDLAFVQGEPPASVLDAKQEPFFITLLLKNAGEYTIPAGRVIASLSGISADAFGLTNLHTKSTFTLDRAQKSRDLVQAGGSEELSFGQMSYIPDLPASFTTDLRADVCYDYGTSVLTKVCLKKNVLERQDTNDNCAVDNAAVSAENSGAPIHVENVKQRPTGTNQIKLTFDVTNKGIGEVYPPGTFMDACFGNKEKRDGLQIEVTSPNKKFNVKCSRFGDGNKGIVRLVNNLKTVTCDIDTSSLQETSFDEVVLITARYMYRDALSVPLTIEDASF